ncbi:MAG: phage holin family protein [Anaerolineales bacterium]|nr:phage holin family protein [Anaerolineales bacterium]
MKRFFIRLFINAVALYIAVLLVNGITLQGQWTSIIWLALIFGLINAILRPLIKFFTLPLIILTLGIFSLIINTFLFWMTSLIGKGFGLGLTIANPVFTNAFLGGLVVSVVGVILSLILRDELKRR